MRPNSRIFIPLVVDTMSGEDEDKLIQFLNEEKLSSQSRMRSTALLLKNDPLVSRNVTARESLEILRNNAEADYDVILHLLTVIQSAKSAEKKAKNHKSESLPIRTTRNASYRAKEDEFDLRDPLDEEFDELPPEIEDDGEEEVKNYEMRNNEIGSNLAKSLPVSVPWPKNPRQKNALPAIVDSEEIPENIHLEIQTIARSLHSEAYDFGEMPKHTRLHNFHAD